MSSPREALDPSPAVGRWRALASGGSLSADGLFDWAESAYPMHFPGHAATRRSGMYVYRHYPATGNYVGVSDQAVYLLGPVSGGLLQRVGTTAELGCAARPSDCPTPAWAMLPRRGFAAGGFQHGWAVTDDGLLLASGREPLAHPTMLRVVPGTHLQQVLGLDRVVLVRELGRTVLALTTRGEVWGWGWHRGLLVGRRDLPEDFQRVPVRLAGYDRVVDLDVDCGLKLLRDDGRVWYPRSARDGDRLLPTAVAGLVDVVALAQGDPFRGERGCGSGARRRDGSLVTIRPRTLDNGDRIESHAVVSGLPVLREQSCSLSHCLAAGVDGALWAWGANDEGQLGDGSTFASARALRIGLAASVRRVRACGNGSYAITETGELWAWGSAWGAGFGVTYMSPSTRPVRIAPASIGVIDFDCDYTLRLLLSDGSVWGIGGNWNDELGLGGTGQVNSFTRIPGLRGLEPHE